MCVAKPDLNIKFWLAIARRQEKIITFLYVNQNTVRYFDTVVVMYFLTVSIYTEWLSFSDVWVPQAGKNLGSPASQPAVLADDIRQLAIKIPGESAYSYEMGN